MKQEDKLLTSLGFEPGTYGMQKVKLLSGLIMSGKLSCLRGVDEVRFKDTSINNWEVPTHFRCL